MIGTHSLAERRVLVAEADWFIGGYLADVLTRADAAVLGPVGDAEAALAMLDGPAIPCAATLAAEMEGGDAVATRLDELGVPFLLLTRLGAAPPPELAARPRLRRPFGGHQVVDAVARMLAR